MSREALEKWLKDRRSNYNYDILPELLQSIYDKNEISTFNDYTGEVNIIRRLPGKDLRDKVSLFEPLDLLQMKNGNVATRNARGEFISYLDAELSELIIKIGEDESGEVAIQHARIEKIDGENVYVGINMYIDVRPPQKEGGFVIVHIENDGYSSGAERDGTYIISLYDTSARLVDKIYIMRGILPMELDYSSPIEVILEDATLMSKFYYINNKLVTSQELEKWTQDGFEHRHHYFHMLPWRCFDVDFEELNPRTLNKRLRAITGERHPALSIVDNPAWSVEGEPNPLDDDKYVD